MNYSKQEFERLFKDSYPHMYRMAFSILENADDAKDAVHQVFAQIWKRKPQVADDSIRGYLLAATRNQCLHTLRSRQLQRQMEDELRQDIAARESSTRLDTNTTKNDKKRDLHKCKSLFFIIVVSDGLLLHSSLRGC